MRHLIRALIATLFCRRVACKAVGHQLQDDPHTSIGEPGKPWRPAKVCGYCHLTEGLL